MKEGIKVNTKKMKEESLITSAQRKASVRCKCSNRVPFKVFNKKGWAICNWCGAKVLKPKENFKQQLLEKLKGE